MEGEMCYVDFVGWSIGGKGVAKGCRQASPRE